MELGCNFDCERLNGIKGKGEGNSGKKPNRRAVFNDKMN